MKKTICKCEEFSIPELEHMMLATEKFLEREKQESVLFSNVEEKEIFDVYQKYIEKSRNVIEKLKNCIDNKN